jgi:hypothetical protein
MSKKFKFDSLYLSSKIVVAAFFKEARLQKKRLEAITVD